MHNILIMPNTTPIETAKIWGNFLRLWERCSKFKHMCNAQRPLIVFVCRSLGVGLKHVIFLSLKHHFNRHYKIFQSRLLVIPLLRMKKDFSLEKHQIKPSLIWTDESCSYTGGPISRFCFLHYVLLLQPTDLNYWIKLLSCIIEANGGHIGLSHINLHWYYWGSRRGFYRFRLLVGMDKHCVNEFLLQIISVSV